MRELIEAQRRMIEVYRDRIRVLKQNKIRLTQQLDSPSNKVEIARIDEQIKTNKDALLRIYANSNFYPVDISILWFIKLLVSLIKVFYLLYYITDSIYSRSIFNCLNYELNNDTRLKQIC